MMKELLIISTMLTLSCTSTRLKTKKGLVLEKELFQDLGKSRQPKKTNRKITYKLCQTEFREDVKNKEKIFLCELEQGCKSVLDHKNNYLSCQARNYKKNRHRF